MGGKKVQQKRGAGAGGGGGTNHQLEAAILGEVANLGSAQVDVVGRAAAALSMAASRDDCPPVITEAMPKLLETLGSATNLMVMRNTVAAITAIASATEAGWLAAVEGGAAARVVRSLAGAASGGDGTAGDDALAINVSEAVGALAGGGAQGLDALVEAGAAEAIVGQLSDGASAGVQEAFADAACALAAPGGPARGRLAAAGAVERLAELLASDNPEVTVRALLALGMLLGGDPDAQRRLAGHPGAVGRLVQLMRADDGDSKAVASGLFKGLASNQECRAAVEEALRGTSASAAPEGEGGYVYV